MGGDWNRGSGGGGGEGALYLQEINEQVQLQKQSSSTNQVAELQRREDLQIPHIKLSHMIGATYNIYPLYPSTQRDQFGLSSDLRLHGFIIL